MTSRLHDASQSSWLSQQDAADYVGVTSRSIRNWISQGRLPAFRVRGGRTIRIKRSDLDELLRPIPTVGGDAA